MKKIIINYFILPLLILSTATTPAYGMLERLTNIGANIKEVIAKNITPENCYDFATVISAFCLMQVTMTKLNVEEVIKNFVTRRDAAKVCTVSASLAFYYTYVFAMMKIMELPIGRNIADKLYLAKLKIKKYIRAKFFTESISITDEEQAKIESFLMLLVEYAEFTGAKASEDELLALRTQLEEQLNILQKSPSIIHIAGNLKDILWLFSHMRPSLLVNSAVKTTIATGLIKEKELIAQGLVPFVHGRRRNYDFLTQLYTLLNAVTTGKKINPDFIPTHLKQPATDILQEKKIRKDLIAQGNHNYDQKKRQTLLFLNHFMFGNINNNGSSSFLYMLSNNNAGNIKIQAKDIFKMFSCDIVYKKYADQLDALAKEYNDVSPLGQMLQLGIDPTKVEKAVYLTTSGGPKKSLQISDGTRTDRMDTIITHLDEHPKDVTEFALVNTFDKYGGLNEYGMKISVLDPADYDSVALAKKIACNNKRDALFSAIEADCIAQKTIVA